MAPLDPSDHRIVQAAQGWLILGNRVEAWAELEQLPLAAREHPEVVATRYELFAVEERWQEAYPIADALVRSAPELASGWLWRAYAARRRPGGGLEEAFNLLRPAADQFPEEAIIPFNLACYSCQLGQLNEALRWLSKAITIGGDSIRALAQTDPDLEPLRAADSM